MADPAQRGPSILVVDDSDGERAALEGAIARRLPGSRVACASRVDAARPVFEADSPRLAVAVVDRQLPDGDGIDLVEAYRDVPCVVVTGTGSERIAAQALRCGAADYVIKEPGHLAAVARSVERLVGRRGGSEPGAATLRFDDFELDLARDELRAAGRPVPIHNMPLRLLAYLVRHADRTVSKDELLEQVWGGTVVSDMAIASALKELRHALHDDGAHQRVIRTRRGSGYRFVAPLERDVARSGPPEASQERTKSTPSSPSSASLRFSS